MSLIAGGVRDEVKQEALGKDLNEGWAATRDSALWLGRE